MSIPASNPTTRHTPKRIAGTLRLPGDKSISHRALMFNALSGGEALITGLSNGGDVHSTRLCLEQLGCQFKTIENGLQLVAPRSLQQPSGTLDCGNSGTTTRLIAGLLAGSGLKTTLIGDDSLSKRPMRRVVDPLTTMGARIDSHDGRLPLEISPPAYGRLSGIDYTLPMASAQVKSALLLAGLWTDPHDPVIVRESQPTRDHTERMLTAMGCPITKTPFSQGSGQTLTLIGRHHDIQPTAIHVPGDLSSAAFHMVACAILPGSTLTLENVSLNPTRTPMLPLLEAIGVTVTTTQESESAGEPLGRVELTSPERLQGTLHIRPDDVPLLIDELPILTILGLFLDGELRLEGAEELRHKESDRLQAMIDIVTTCGVDFEETRPDGFVLRGNPTWTLPEQAYQHRFQSHHDHRIVMSLEVLGLRGPAPLDIDGREWVSISYPDFYADLERLCLSS